MISVAGGGDEKGLRLRLRLRLLSIVKSYVEGNMGIHKSRGRSSLLGASRLIS